MITSVRDGILKVKGLWKEGEEEEPSFFEEKNQVRSKRIEKTSYFFSGGAASKGESL